MPIARSLAENIGMTAMQGENNAFRVVAHNPDIAATFFSHLRNLASSTRFPARLREFIIMRIGWVTGCDYEWVQHWRLAQAIGISTENLVAVREWRESDVLDDTDQAVLACVDEVLCEGFVSPDSWARCQQAIGGPAEMIEMMAVISFWQGISQLLRSTRAPLNDGETSWPPDGRAPTYSH
ncbi:MAG: carboxymuconolactone decarboxylase family protein [Sphingobium sp.]